MVYNGSGHKWEEGEVIYMGILGWIIIGALAGWIASILTRNNAHMGAIANIVVGVIGGFGKKSYILALEALVNLGAM